MQELSKQVILLVSGGQSSYPLLTINNEPIANSLTYSILGFGIGGLYSMSAAPMVAGAAIGYALGYAFDLATAQQPIYALN